MPTHRVLQTHSVSPDLDARLQAMAGAHPLWKEADPQAFLAAHGGEFEAMVAHVRFGCSAELMAALPRLRAICSFGAGYDKIDMEAARARGIQVATTPGANSGCVADLAMGLLIDAARGISVGDRFVRAGGWAAGGQRPVMTRVHGKTLGLLGFGGIGQAIARRAAGFDMPVRYTTRRPVAGAEAQHEPDLKALAAWADFLVVACSGGPSTRHLVSAEVLAALGPQGILVNIARGSVVDEAALVSALAEGRLGGAGLDVFENEPHVPAELLALDSVVVLSHIGGFTRETRSDMEQMVYDNLSAFLERGQVLNPV